MDKLVKDVIADHSEVMHGITFAIHQNSEECVATFYKSAGGSDRPDKIVFTGWNDIKNKTGYTSEKALLNACVGYVKEITRDWIDIIVIPIEEANSIRLV